VNYITKIQIFEQQNNAGEIMLADSKYTEEP
jgi:hypothetical protein